MPLMQPPATKFRELAEEFREWCDPGRAELLEKCAAYCEAWDRERGTDVLTLQQAARLGYGGYSTLQKKVASGDIPNVGRKGAPRVLRADVEAHSNGKRRITTIDQLIEKHSP